MTDAAKEGMMSPKDQYDESRRLKRERDLVNERKALAREQMDADGMEASLVIVRSLKAFFEGKAFLDVAQNGGEYFVRFRMDPAHD